MKLGREFFRANMFSNFRSVLSQQQCMDELNSIFGDEGPMSLSMVL